MSLWNSTPFKIKRNFSKTEKEIKIPYKNTLTAVFSKTGKKQQQNPSKTGFGVDLIPSKIFF